MDWSGVDHLWIIVMFLSAVWTLILTAPIHCRGSIAEQVMQCYIFPNLFSCRNKFIYILGEWFLYDSLSKWFDFLLTSMISQICLEITLMFILMWRWFVAGIVHLKMHFRSEVMTSEGPQVEQRHTEAHFKMKGDRHSVIHIFCQRTPWISGKGKFTQKWKCCHYLLNLKSFQLILVFHITLLWWFLLLLFFGAWQHLVIISYKKSYVTSVQKMSAFMMHGKIIAYKSETISGWENIFYFCENYSFKDAILV